MAADIPFLHTNASYCVHVNKTFLWTGMQVHSPITPGKVRVARSQCHWEQPKVCYKLPLVSSDLFIHPSNGTSLSHAL